MLATPREMAVAADLIVQGSDAKVQEHCHHEHDRGVAKGEEEPDRQPSLSVVD